MDGLTHGAAALGSDSGVLALHIHAQHAAGIGQQIGQNRRSGLCRRLCCSWSSDVGHPERRPAICDRTCWRLAGSCRASSGMPILRRSPRKRLIRRRPCRENGSAGAAGASLCRCTPWRPSADARRTEPGRPTATRRRRSARSRTAGPAGTAPPASDLRTAAPGKTRFQPGRQTPESRRSARSATGRAWRSRRPIRHRGNSAAIPETRRTRTPPRQLP